LITYINSEIWVDLSSNRDFFFTTIHQHILQETNVV
jgi:hypothetical protein